MNSYTLLLIGLTAIYSILITIPESASYLSLPPREALQGEYWRLLTYQFAHVDFTHLITNLLALAVVVALGLELEAEFSLFSTTYFLAGVLATLPLWLVTSLTLLGASSAIYGTFGLLMFLSTRYHLKPFVLLGALLLPMGAPVVKEGLICISCPPFMIAFNQLAAHLLGLTFGILTYFTIQALRTKKEDKKRGILRSFTTDGWTLEETA